MRRMRIANLPPEVSDRTLRVAMGRYGEVRDIQEENWSRAYRYPVTNGIRIAMLNLVQHIPSHIVVAGHRQPTTRYNNNNNNNKVQLGYNPVAVVILHVHKYEAKK
jgi:hypothetical protein